MKAFIHEQSTLWKEKTTEEIMQDLRRAFDNMQLLTGKTKEEKELCYGKKKL